jgi:hypothetical protein
MSRRLRATLVAERAPDERVAVPVAPAAADGANRRAKTGAEPALP